jgi:hypothetical protein
MNRLGICAISIAAASLPAAAAKSPDCAGVERWATSMALVHLKNAGLVNSDSIDVKKTATVRLASEKIGKDLYRQIHYVVFTQKTGEKIQVITTNNASSEECSMSGVDVYVVSRKIDGGK